MKTLIYFICIPLLLISCTYDEKPEFIQVNNIKIIHISVEKIKFEAKALFKNPNDIGGKLITENIDIFADNELVGSISAEEFNVPVRDTFLIPLKGNIATSKIFKKKGSDILNTVLSILQKKKVAIRFKGDIVFKKGPFSYTYNLDHTNEVDIKL